MNALTGDEDAPWVVVSTGAYMTGHYTALTPGEGDILSLTVQVFSSPEAAALDVIRYADPAIIIPLDTLARELAAIVDRAA